MRYEGDDERILEQAKIEADRKMIEIRSMLAPGVHDVVTLEDLKTYLEGQLKELPPAERQALRVKMAIALADLNEVTGMLNGHLDNVRDELRIVNSYRGANEAYGRTTAPRKMPRY